MLGCGGRGLKGLAVVGSALLLMALCSLCWAQGAKGPPPAVVRPATDFVYFSKPIVLNGRTYQDLVKVDALLRH